MNEQTRPHFAAQMAFADKHLRFTDCPYYPCHPASEGKVLENCLFCYCPLYPCGMEERGGTWITGKDGRPLWDCSGCLYIHQNNTVDLMMEHITSGLNARQADADITSEGALK